MQTNPALRNLDWTAYVPDVAAITRAAEWLRVGNESRDGELRSSDGDQVFREVGATGIATSKPTDVGPEGLRPQLSGELLAATVEDRTEVLISSANLTSAALDRNMELGLVVDGGATARVIEQHYDGPHRETDTHPRASVGLTDATD